MGRPRDAAVKVQIDLKGKPGGDPSRRPQLVTVEFACVVCKKPGSAETRRPNAFNPPKTCSADCSSALVRKNAEALVRYAIGRDNTPSVGSISQQMAERVIAANTWREQAEIGRVRKVEIVCAHCGRAAVNFTSHKSSTNVSKFCSRECKASDNAGLPKGIICPSPTKTSHVTYDESRQAADKMTAQLLLLGDTEGVVAYECSCGKWHVGHPSKEAWNQSARAAIARMNEMTLDLIQYRKGLKRRYG